MADSAFGLRQKAEAHIEGDGGATNPVTALLDALTPEQTRHVLHELQVHQIELEMQNEELRRTQLALDTSHSRYAALYDLAPVGYCTLSEQGLILQANLTATCMLGVPRQALRTMSLFRFIAPQDQDGYYHLLGQLIKSGQRKNCELQMVRLDGTPFWVNLTSDIAADQEGEMALHVVMSDISDRKQAELAQRRSERFFETIANNIPAMMSYWTSDLQCTFANSAYLDWFGRTPAQMQGIRMQDLLGDDLFRRNEPFVRAVLTGEDQQFERQLVKYNGEVRLVLAHYIADHTAEAVSGFFVWVSDITTVKSSEEALRIAAVAFESQDAIVVMDAERMILKANRAFILLSGFSESDLVGKTATRFRSTRHPPAFYAHIWSEATRTGTWQGDMWAQRPNGDELLVRVAVSAVRNEIGQTTHYVSSFSDVTRDRQMEQKRLVDESAHRNLLVREVHHRIKNNLQGISGLLRQLSQNNPTLAGDVEKTMSQVHSISLVHGLQGRDISAAIHLGDLIAAIARDIGGLWQTTVSLSNLPELLQRTVAENEAVPIALVLNELVLNAVKHGGKAAGGVNIALQDVPQRDAVQVKISNQGLLLADRSRNGKSHSGLQLVSALMPQVGATLTVQQEGEQVVALLELASPIIEAAPKEST